MFPSAHQVFGNPNAAGPSGLAGAVAKLFGSGGSLAPPPEKTDPATGAPDLSPDPYANLDPKFLLARFDAAKKDMQNLRWVFERMWWRVMLYLLDRQWIFFDAKRNEWRDRRLKKWIPKPVTNRLRAVQSTIRSMFAAVDLGVLARPNGNDPKNITTANTVDGLQPLVHKEHQMDTRLALSDFWTVNIGTSAFHVWWNPDAGIVEPVMHEQCTACGTIEDPAQAPVPGQFTCPQCGNPQSQPVKVGDEPQGAGCTDVVSPFELLLPSYASEWDQVDKLIRVRWRTKEYYEQNYPELAPKLNFEKQTSERTLNMFKALAAQSTMGTMPFSGSGGSGSGDQSLGITEFEYWEKPNKQWPKGLFFRVAGEKNEQIVTDPEQSMPGPLPYTTIKGEPLWPWILNSYEPFGGRLWALGAIDPLIQKQDQLNQLDSHMQLSMQRMGNPIWLEPKGAEVEKFTGEPGLVVKYTTVGVQGAKPERLQGEPINQSYFQLREQYLQDIEDLAGTYDVLKGSKPTGVEAFSALQLLVERSQSRFTAAFKARGEAYREWYAVAIELERKYGPTQRTLSLLGPNNTWTFQSFQNADLQGDVSVVTEDGTNVPKTALGKRAAMETANNMGFINPQDPDVKHAFMNEMGLSHLMPGLDAQKQNALRQQDAFEQWATNGAAAQGQPPPLKIQPWDDPDILLGELRKWANSDRMQAIFNDPKIGQLANNILNQFYGQLVLMVQQAQMAQAAMQGGGPGGGGPGGGGHPAPGHAPGAGQAMSRSNGNSHPPNVQGQGRPSIASSPA